MHVDFARIVAFDATGAQVTGALAVATLQVAGPGSYSTDGIPFDFSAQLSSIICVLGSRQFRTSSGKAPNATAIMDLLPIEATPDLFASAKLRLVLGRGTPTGTVAAPVFTGSAIGGAHSCGAVGCDSTHPAATTVPAGTCGAPAFTGTAAGRSELSAASGAALNNTYEVTVLGVRK